MKSRKSFFQGALVGALVVFAVVFAGPYIANGLSIVSGGKISLFQKNYTVSEKLQKLDEIIEENYLWQDTIDHDDQLESMYAGYVDGLGDPYSVYYTEEEAEEMFQELSGEYSGIGAMLSQDAQTGEVTITKVYDGQPAQEAGIQAGDVLYQVDERETAEEDLTEIVTWIKGEENTTVTLGLLRDGEELEIPVTRRTVEMQTVEYAMKEGQVGYIAVSEFDDVTDQQFETALAELRKQGMTGLVIDLRNNPGGNLSTVVSVLRQILPEGDIVSMKYKDGQTEKYTCDGDNAFDLPLAVLVNEYSASASEIFAGAVQDHGIGQIVGETTYGKGVVQQILSVGDGSYLKVTVSEYFTPNGNSIHGEGVKPDVEIAYEVNENDSQADNQLEKAIEILQN